MKKFFLILGGIFASILAVIVIAAAIFIPRSLKLDRDATAYIQDAVPKIVAHWNSQELVSRATPNLLSAAKSRDGIDRLFVMFQQLGSLDHLGIPKGEVESSAFSGAGVATFGNYTVRSNFKNGEATIQIQLLRLNDGWKINGFHINSDVFLPHKS